VAQGVGPEFKPRYSKKKKKRRKNRELVWGMVVYGCNPSYAGSLWWQRLASGKIRDPIQNTSKEKKGLGASGLCL
jgi:hypothetical protein